MFLCETLTRGSGSQRWRSPASDVVKRRAFRQTDDGLRSQMSKPRNRRRRAPGLGLVRPFGGFAVNLTRVTRDGFKEPRDKIKPDTSQPQVVGNKRVV